MKAISYYSFDGKEEKLGPGPWQEEPDKLQWEDEETKYPCLAKRSRLGMWCGYVGVPPGHPAYEKHYDEVGVDVHGGLSFSDRCSRDEDEFIGICHKVEEGESDDVWWLGFDCGHGHIDIIPSMLQKELTRWRYEEGWPGSMFEDCQYRDLGYVTEQIKNLARQLRGMENEGRQDSHSIQRTGNP